MPDTPPSNLELEVKKLIKTTCNFFTSPQLKQSPEQPDEWNFVLHLEYFNWLLELAFEKKFEFNKAIIDYISHQFFLISECLYNDFYKKNRWIEHSTIKEIFSKLCRLPNIKRHNDYSKISRIHAILTNPLQSQKTASIQPLTQTLQTPSAIPIDNFIETLQSAAAAVWSDPDSTDAHDTLNQTEIQYRCAILAQYWLSTSSSDTFHELGKLANELHRLGYSQHALGLYQSIRTSLLKYLSKNPDGNINFNLFISGLQTLSQQADTPIQSRFESVLWHKNLDLLKKTSPSF